MPIRIFGDSFSTPFHFNYNLDLRFCTDYLKVCLENGDIPKDWIELLKETSKEIQVYSIPGSDNLTLFESVLRRIPELKENDIAIFGWTTLDRVRSYEKTSNFVTGEEMFMSVLMGFENDRFIADRLGKDKIFLNEWLLYKETHPNSAHELLDWIDIVNKLLEEKSIKPIHWFWNPFQFGYNREIEPSFEKIHVHDRLINTKGIINLHFGDEGLWNQHDNDAILWDPNGYDFCSYKNSIYYATGNQVKDCHWDLKGHEIFFKIINEEIENIYKRT
jgi:hypothetical protein